MLYLELAFTNTKRNICNYIFPLHVIVIGAKKNDLRRKFPQPLRGMEAL